MRCQEHTQTGLGRRTVQITWVDAFASEFNAATTCEERGVIGFDFAEFARDVIPLPTFLMELVMKSTLNPPCQEIAPEIATAAEQLGVRAELPQVSAMT